MAQIFVKGLGTVSVPDRLTDPENKDELIDQLTTLAAETVPQEEWYRTFTEDFARSASETARGTRQKLGQDPENEWNKEFWAQVYAKQNPKASLIGSILGGFGDVPSYFFGGFARKGAGLLEDLVTRGVMIGGASGLIAPTYEGVTDSQFEQTYKGALTGGILAGSLAPVLKLFGAKSQSELQKMYAEADDTKKAEMEAAVQDLVEKETQALQRMGERGREQAEISQNMERVRNMASQQAELERIRGIDLRTDVTDADKLADIERIRQIGKDADVANIRKIGDDAEAARDADIQARIAELRADVGTLPTGTQQKAIEQAVKENEGIAKSLEKRVANIQKAIDGLKKNKKIAPKKKREQMQPLQAELKRLQDEAALRRQQNKDTYEPLTARLKELRRAQQELRIYDKTGELPPSLKINQPVQRSAEELKQMELQDIPSELKQPVEEPQLQAIPESVQGTPQRSAARIRMEQAKAQQAAEEGQPRLSDTPEGRAIEAEKAARPSGGAAGVDILKVPTGAADAVNMNVNAKAFRDLEPRGTGGRDLTRPEEIRTARKQQLERDTESLFRVDDIEGKYTFQKLFDAADDKLEFVNREIDEGNYKDATDWLTQEFENSNSKILSPAAKMVAARIYAVASEKLDRLDTVFRQYTRSGELSEKSLNTLYEMQVDKELHAAMDYMRNIQRIEEADKRNTSDALRAFRKANEEQKKHQEQLRNGYATRLFFGVKC